MKYKIDRKILIDNQEYCALGDDFSFAELESLDFIINKIEFVLLGKSQEESIYGNMCYEIIVSKNSSSIFCYDEFLGEEPTIEIYNMFNAYRNYIKNLNMETAVH